MPTVKVITLTREEFELNYDDNMLILDLKKKLTSLHPKKPHPQTQKLICSGKLAINTQKVSEFVANSEVIHLLFTSLDDSKSSSTSKVEKSKESSGKNEIGGQSSSSSTSPSLPASNKKDASKDQPLKDSSSSKSPTELEIEKIKEKLYQNYLLKQQLDTYHLQETLQFMKYKGIKKHPVLQFDESILAGVRKRNVLNLLNGLSGGITGEDKEISRLIGESSNNDETQGQAQNSQTQNLNQGNQEQPGPAALLQGGAAADAPVAAQNQPPPAVDPEQFDIVDRFFSFIQIILFIGMMYFRSSSGNLYYFGGFVLAFILFKLYRNGYLRPGRRNNNGGENNANNNNNDANRGSNTGNAREGGNRGPPGFLRVLKTFVFSFVRSLIPEQLPPGVVAD